MSLSIRLAKYEDREAACAAEGKAIRGLTYLNDMWDEFYRDQSGLLLVGEYTEAGQSQVVAVGKYTLLPDHSAWLETLRVDPAYQGRGIGKAFYERFLQQAQFQGVQALRMYTGTSNKVSKGLAERYGFRLEAAYRGASWTAPAEQTHLGASETGFARLGPTAAVAQLLPLVSAWDGHVVMNRTFYPANTAIFAAMAREGKVYAEPQSGSICILGHRFLPERGLHLALLAGDEDAVLRFAKDETVRRGLPKVTVNFPPSRSDMQQRIVEHGFELEAGDCIVMGRHS